MKLSFQGVALLKSTIHLQKQPVADLPDPAGQSCMLHGLESFSMAFMLQTGLQVQEIVARMKDGHLPSAAELDAALAPIIIAAAQSGAQPAAAAPRPPRRVNSHGGTAGWSDEDLEVCHQL